MWKIRGTNLGPGFLVGSNNGPCTTLLLGLYYPLLSLTFRVHATMSDFATLLWYLPLSLYSLYAFAFSCSKGDSALLYIGKKVTFLNIPRISFAFSVPRRGGDCVPYRSHHRFKSEFTNRNRH